MTTYSKVLKIKLAHVLVVSIPSNEVQMVEHAEKRNGVELKLIVAISNLSKFSAINPIHVVLDEKLSKILIRSCTRFLLNTHVINV